MMAGVMLVVMGLTGMGSAVKFIPRPVVVGFTNGIAVLIASTQLRDFFGVDLKDVPGEFWPRIVALASHARTFSPQATLVAVVTLAIIIAIVRFVPRVPGSIVALVAVTVGARVLGLHVETIGSRFGGIPSGLPHFAIPAFHPSLVPRLLMPAITVGLLGAIESLMSAVVADKMSGDRHDSNIELVAQGVANIISPMVGGLPATGAIARTATNIRSGAKTPVAGIVHSLTLLTILLVAAPLASAIPMAVLAAILMVVAYNMGEWSEIPDLLKLARADIAVWIATFALTVFADLTVAVEVGMILAALLFIRKVSETTTIAPVTEEYIRESHHHSLHRLTLPSYIRIFRIHGPFLFGATDKLRIVTEDLDALPEIVVLRLRNMNAHRRHRPARVRGSGRRAARVRAHAAAVRRPAAAGAPDGARRFSPPCRRREHLQEYRRRDRARRAAPCGKEERMSSEPSKELQTLKAEFFRAMAHPARIRILEVLSDKGEHSVQALQARLSVDQPVVSQQLAKLRAHGVVTARKEGTAVS